MKKNVQTTTIIALAAIFMVVAIAITKAIARTTTIEAPITLTTTEATTSATTEATTAIRFENPNCYYQDGDDEYFIVFANREVLTNDPEVSYPSVNSLLGASEDYKFYLIRGKNSYLSSDGVLTVEVNLRGETLQVQAAKNIGGAFADLELDTLESIASDSAEASQYGWEEQILRAWF